MKVKIFISQDKELIDDKLEIKIMGLSSNQKVKLRAETHDDLGRRWGSEGVFYSDQNGNLDLSKSAPESGSYRGCFADGLLWSMRLEEEVEDAPPIFLKTSTGSQKVTLSLFQDEQTLVKKNIILNFFSADVEISTITEGFVGKLFRPKEKNNLPALVVLGGSAGGFMWSEQIAAVLSSQGYLALAVNYFDAQGSYDLPRQLIEIPLEYTLRALTWLQKQPGVDSTKIGLIGISKGAEMSLLLSSLVNQRLAAIIAYVPASHVFEGISWANHPDKSSWTYRGEPVAFLGYPEDTNFTMTMDPTMLLQINQRALVEASDEELATARIKVEHCHSPLLLISGEKDHTWPSSKMCSALINILQEKGYTYEAKHFNFPKMGHAFFLPNLPPIIDSTKLNVRDAAQANRRAWDEVSQFLKKYL